MSDLQQDAETARRTAKACSQAWEDRTTLVKQEMDRRKRRQRRQDLRLKALRLEKEARTPKPPASPPRMPARARQEARQAQPADPWRFSASASHRISLQPARHAWGRTG